MTIGEWELRAEVDGYQTYVNTITGEVDVVDGYGCGQEELCARTLTI